MIKELIRTENRVEYQITEAGIDIRYVIIKINRTTSRIEIYTENGKLELGTTEYSLANFYMVKNHSDIVRKSEWL